MWLGILVSLLCLAALFLFISPAEIVEALSRTNYGYLAAGTACMFVFMILRAFRWRFMLVSGHDNQSARDVSYGQVFHIQNIGYMLTNLLPLRMGDVARAVLIGNVPPLTVFQGLSTMVVERILDLLFFVILFPFTLAAVSTLPENVRAAVRYAGILAFGAAAFLIAAANQRQKVVQFSRRFLAQISYLNAGSWTDRLDDLLLGLNALTRLRDGFILIASSILIWIPIIVGYFLALRAVNLNPSFGQAAFITCISAFSVTAPSSPGQIGVFEAAVTFALVSILGQPEGQSASFAFLWHAANYVSFGLLGVIGVNRTSATLSQVVHSARAMVGTRTRG